MADNADMQVKWNYFLKTIHNKELLFSYVIEKIEQFIKPIYVSIIEENEFFENWNPTEYEWIVK